MKIKEGYRNFIKSFLLIIIIGFCLDILSECSNEIFNIRNLINTFLGKAIWFGMAGALLLTIVLYKKVVEENKIKKSILNEEIWICSKMGLIIGMASLTISRISLESIDKLFNIAAENVLLIYIIITAIVYVKRKFIYKEISKKKFLEILLNTYLYITYLVMFSTSIYGIKYFVLSFFTLIILTISRLLIEGKEPNIKSKTLYKEREYQLEAFDSIINDRIIDKVDNNYAVALCGEWGSGKSEFLKTYISREKYRDKNYFIYIKPMIRCSIESFMNQFSEQLKTIMKEQQIYHSIDNIEMYFREVLKILGKKTSMPLDSWLFKGGDKDNYLSYKEKTQKSINELAEYGHKRLVVIIDDFDRLDEKHQELVLSFVKEIVDFHNCITVFGLDLNLLKDNEKITPEYLEKFVDRKFNLYKVPYEELLKVHGEEILSMVESQIEYINELRDDIIENSYDYYDSFKNTFLNNKQDYSVLVNIISKNMCNKSVECKEEKNHETEEIFMDLEHKMSNSRRVIHFFDEVRESLDIIDKMYFDNEEIVTLLKEIDVGKIMYLMNFIKVFQEELFLNIVKCGGVKEYQNKINKLDESNNDIFCDILKDFEFSKRYDDIERHRINNIIRFIDNMFFDANFIRNAIKLNPLSKEIMDCFLNDKEWKDILSIEDINLELLSNIENQIGYYFSPYKEENAAKCIKKYMNLCFYALENGRINNKELIRNILKDGYNEVPYTIEYLGKITEKLRGFSKEEKQELDIKMNRWLEMNVSYHKGLFEDIIILFNVEIRTYEISQKLKRIHDFKGVLDYVGECIDSDEKYMDEKSLVELIRNKIEQCSYKEKRSMGEKFIQFINNNRIIKEIILCKDIIDQNEGFAKNLDLVYTAQLNSCYDAERRIKRLANEANLDKVKINYFNYLLSSYEDMYNTYKNELYINEELINNVNKILGNIDKDTCDDNLYNRILLLVRRLQEMKVNEDKLENH